MSQKISIIPARELDASLSSRWQALLQGQEDLSSPFYQPAFTQAVAQGRPDAQLAIIERDQRIEGFLPFHRNRWGRLLCIGEGFNDYQGVIAAPDTSLDAPALLRACGAWFMTFDHIPMAQRCFRPYVRTSAFSPVMDISGGIEAYKQRLQARPEGGSSLLRTLGRRRRQLEREIGPLRFELRTDCEAVFNKLIEWKTAHFTRTAGADSSPFQRAWVKTLLKSIRHAKSPEFSGVLSALYAGNQLIACHFGIRSQGLLHCWFPTYDPAFSRYSPGLLLVMAIAEEAESHALQVFDFGKGNQLYKLQFHTHKIPLGIGAISCPPGLARLANRQKNLVDRLKNGPVGDLWRARKRIFNA